MPNTVADLLWATGGIVEPIGVLENCFQNCLEFVLKWNLSLFG